MNIFLNDFINFLIKIEINFIKKYYISCSKKLEIFGFCLEGK